MGLVPAVPALPLFSMLTVLAYLRAFPEDWEPRSGWLVAAFCLFAAALLCKAVAVSLPVVFLILDIYPLRRLGLEPRRWFDPPVRAVWWEKVPFVGLSLIFMGLAIAGRVGDRGQTSVQDWGIAARIARSCYGIWLYPVKTILPWNITAYYPVPERMVWYEPRFVASILATIVVSAALFLLRRRWPGLLAAWLSYLVILAPNLGMIRINNQIAADRYSYIAMMGWVVLVAAGLGHGWHAVRRAPPAAAGLTAAGLVVLLGLILLSRDQCGIWRNSEVLWRHTLAHGASRSSMAHLNLGVVLEKQGRLGEAQAEYAESVRLDPTFAPPRLNLGMLLEKQGRLGEAQAEYAENARLDPTFAPVHHNLGVLLEKQGQIEEARAEYAESARLDPTFAPVHVNLGVLLEKQGRIEEARAEYAESVRLDPSFAPAHNNLGVVLEKLGRLTEAQAEYAESVRLDPAGAAARINLGSILWKQQRFEEARTVFAAALRLHPDNAAAHTNLGVFLLHQGQLEEARAEFAAALRINPELADAHNNLGSLLSRKGWLEEARAEFAAALRINPSSVVARNNLRSVLQAQGRFAEAGALFREAMPKNSGTVR